MTWRGREPRLSVRERFCYENVTPLGVSCDASFAHLEIVVNNRETRASITESPLPVTFQATRSSEAALQPRKGYPSGQSGSFGEALLSPRARATFSRRR